MVWYRLYTDITPPPFIGLSHDFLPILKSKKKKPVILTHLYQFLLSLRKGQKEKLHPLGFFLHISTSEGATVQQEKSDKNRN